MDLKFFKISEFSCKCCGYNNINKNFVKKLDEARSEAGIPFFINSGCRCEKHNKEVGGKPGSSHIKGLSADIFCVESTKRLKIIKALLNAGFERIGIAKTFIHIDIDSEKQKGIWLYV